MNPPAPTADSRTEWLADGNAYFASLIALIHSARRSIDFEVYIFSVDDPGPAVRNALVLAARRGVRIRVLVDYVGSISLPHAFWDPLTAAGGQFVWFSPHRLRPIRDHRKLAVVDGVTALVGGFNVAPEYVGDGITRGWRDVAVLLRGSVAVELAAAFDRMFRHALQHGPRRLDMLRRGTQPSDLDCGPDGCVLLGGPGRNQGPIARALVRDLARARDVRIMVPYFLPGIRLRRALQRVVRKGGAVELILPGRTDVRLSRSAARSLYQKLLRHGVRIREYQPQVLHAKLYIVDDATYIGSCNLDTRSLHINFELLVRLVSPAINEAARAFFSESARHTLEIRNPNWRQQRGFLEKLEERWSHFLLSRVDPYVTFWLSRRS